jgi:hypothetical protein
VTPEQEIANNLPPAAMAFFILFSRFECALKRAKYIQADASAAWDRFGKELGREFFDQVKATGKAKTLLENPPKKQVVANGGLGCV